jgi:hypothetical protein
VLCIVFAWILLSQPAGAADPLSPELLSYNLSTTTEAYQTAGRKDPKWDLEVGRAFTIYSRIRAWTNGNPNALPAELRNSLARLAALGCDDPLVGYLQLRFGTASEDRAPGKSAQWQQVARSLQASRYPNLRKFYANVWAAQIVGAPQKVTWLEMATANLEGALRERAIPAIEVDQSLDLLFSSPWWAEPTRWTLYTVLEPALTNQWKNTFPAHLTRGRALLSHAWEARGLGYASTVSEQAAVEMARRLTAAAESLEKAWQIKRDGRVCIEMMRVELGQHRGQAQLDLWFERGMKLNPNNYELCSEKLEYLRPRWYGSIDEMIAFGRACTLNTNYSGPVRLLLADAHYEASREIQDDAKRAAYWRQPSVWRDIQSAFEQFFQIYPHEVGYRHNYARYASMCGQWQTFLAQARLFPNTNYQYFGGEERFRHLVKTAEASTVGK